MAIRIPSTDLGEALAAVARACGRQQANPSVLIELSQTSLSLTRATLETAARRSIEVESSIVDAFTLPATPLYDLLQVVSGADLELTLDGRDAVVRVGMFDTRLRMGSAAEFLMPAISEGTIRVRVDGRQLADAAARVAFARSSDEHQPQLVGIFLNAADGRITLAATDGHRAAEARSPATVLSPLNGLIVPARPLTELSGILHMDSAQFELVAPDRLNWLRIQRGPDFVQTQLIDGKYPNYAAVRPTNIAAEAELDKSSLILAVRGCGVFSGESFRVSLAIEEGRLAIVGESTELGSNRASVVATVRPTTGSGRCALNGKYFLDALDACPGATIRIQFESPTAPLTIVPTMDKEFWAATNPIAPAVGS